MAVEVFVHFNGNCREAVEFYAKVFGTEKPEMLAFRDAPHNPESTLSEAGKDLIMYTSLSINGSTVMFSDMMPTMPVIVGNNINLTITKEDMDEIKALFNQLKEGGNVVMNLQETFWSKCYGIVVDKYGISWHLNYGFVPF